MAIDALGYGKNLRPSTVDTMAKVNEIITAVNALQESSGSSEAVDQLTTRVTALESTVSTQGENITSLQSSVSSNAASISSLNSDMDNVKTTLYTPINNATDSDYEGE